MILSPYRGTYKLIDYYRKEKEKEMRYQGGKFWQRKQIKQAIMKDLEGRELSGTYIEPFIGGGAMAAVMGNEFNHAHYSDTHPDLMMMWEAVHSGEMDTENIHHPSREEYNELRHAEPSAYRGLIGFSASFGGGWFKGFICSEKRHKDVDCSVSATARRIKGDIITMSGQESTTFYHRDYRDVIVKEGDVIYCDPPYVNTHGYSVGEFDTLLFWNTMREWADLGAYVYVSEYNGPDDIPVICEQSKNTTLAGMRYMRKVIDKLYRVHT